MPLLQPVPGLTPGDVSTLSQRVRGAVLLPDHPDYDAARTIWNARIDRHPALILRCADRGDVVEALTLARGRGVPLSVRGGGHGVSGHAVCDGGIVVDLSGMRGVGVDGAARTARVAGGATWGDVDRAAQAAGLATPGGIVSTTGVGGLTLGGGYGWLGRLHGLAADNVRSVEIVTADGRILTASAREHDDLFWGVRGGGANFGVVTSFEFALHPLGPDVLFGPTFYRLEDAPAVLRHYREFARDAPRACTVYVNFLIAPPLPILPASIHGRPIVALIQCFAGDAATGERVLAPLRQARRPLADAVSARAYVDVQHTSDASYDKGWRNYWNAHNLAALDDETIATLVGLAGTLPTPQSDMMLFQLGGAIDDMPPDATAYPHRGVAFVVSPGARWSQPLHDELCIGWVRGCHAALRRHASGGAYVNFIAERYGRARDAYGAHYARLADLKRRYDPENVFRSTHNVPPAV
jgi:FAD/FMN-containing dehydrogenase